MITEQKAEQIAQSGLEHGIGTTMIQNSGFTKTNCLISIDKYVMPHEKGRGWAEQNLDTYQTTRDFKHRGIVEVKLS